MTMRRLLPVAALAATLCTLPAATADAARKPGSACAGRRPTGLLIVPDASGTKVQVSWARPRKLRGALRYRVLRDGAVVRQTRRRTMTVNVRPAKSFRIVVRPVLRSGKVLTCSVAAVRSTTHEPPASPEDVAVSDVTETGATLSWAAVRPRAGGLAGYRVLRNGATVKQVAGTSLVVALAPRRDYVLTVVAIDRSGYASAPSRPVRINSGHAAPTAPSGLTATDVKESGFTLHWTGSTVRTGRIIGYRVFRDGETVGQTQATSLSIGGVGAGEQHEMTVRAIDNLGYMSDNSVPLTVGTTPPPQTTGDVHAFLLATTGQSFADLRSHYMKIGTVYPTYFECGEQNDIVGRDDPLVTRWSRARGIKVLPRIDCQVVSRVHAILTDPATRAAALDRLVALVGQHGYDGVNIDFEGVLPADRNAYTSFVSDLTARLHAIGGELTISVSPMSRETLSGRQGLFDYPALGRIADTIFVMAWGKHWTTSTSGPLADFPWVKTIIDYVAQMPNQSRWVVGAGLYGLDWPQGGLNGFKGEPREWADVQQVIASSGAHPDYDFVSLAPHFFYTGDDGLFHDVWYTDAQSLRPQFDYTRTKGLKIGMWRLGEEDPAIWGLPAIAG